MDCFVFSKVTRRIQAPQGTIMYGLKQNQILYKLRSLLVKDNWPDIYSENIRIIQFKIFLCATLLRLVWKHSINCNHKGIITSSNGMSLFGNSCLTNSICKRKMNIVQPIQNSGINNWNMKEKGTCREQIIMKWTVILSKRC